MIDITVKSATEFKIVAPTWDMVIGLKKGKITKDEYTLLYLNILDNNEYNILEQFKAIDADQVILACYCRPKAFCHRVILANWLSSRLGWECRGEK